MRRDRFYREASYTFENHQSRRVPTRNVDPVTTTISEASALRLATANASTGSVIARPQTPKSPATLANRCGLAATRPAASKDVNVNVPGSSVNGAMTCGTSLVSLIAITNEKRRPGNVWTSARASSLALSALCAISKTTEGYEGKNSIRPGMTRAAK